MLPKNCCARAAGKLGGTGNALEKLIDANVNRFVGGLTNLIRRRQDMGHIGLDHGHQIDRLLKLWLLHKLVYFWCYTTGAANPPTLRAKWVGCNCVCGGLFGTISLLPCLTLGFVIYQQSMYV
jgi:hypothetical protein